MIGIKRPIHIIRKGHGVYTFHPEGPALLRNPPPTAFKRPGENDIPLFAHDGHGNIDEGVWDLGPHGEHVYRTARGDFRHGMRRPSILVIFYKQEGITHPQRIY